MFRELLSCFGTIEEPRQCGKVVHRLIDILAITVCAVLTHAETFEDIALYGRHKEEWLRKFLELPFGIPSHDTFRRVFMLIDANAFEDCFLLWTRAVFTPSDDQHLHHIAVDGKTMRRSFDRSNGKSPLHVVSAFATQSGLTLAQRVVTEKTSETEALLPLLEGLELAGALISLDALYAKKTVAKDIVERGADYLLALKRNNKKDHAHVVEFFRQHAFDRGATMQAVFDAFDDTHGRLVRRRVFITSDSELTKKITGWAHLAQIIAVETVYSVNHTHGGERGKTTADIRYFLTSSTESGKVLAAAVRDHWSIENSLHWVLDIGFREDECRIRHRNAAANIAVIRKIAINLVKADTSTKGSIKGKRKAAGWNNQYMQHLIKI